MLEEDAAEEKWEFEEHAIADIESDYLDEVRDRAVPMIHELVKTAGCVLIAEGVLYRYLQPIPLSPAPAPQMQTLKFPTFSGDIRDYKQFK